MINYTAEDGLNVLTYFGILNLTDCEWKVFRERWEDIYSFRKDLIGAVWHLYAEVLPFTCGDKDRGSFVVAQLRDSDFGERLSESRFDEKLKEGKLLKEIFDESPDRFARMN